MENTLKIMIRSCSLIPKTFHKNSSYLQIEDIFDLLSVSKNINRIIENYYEIKCSHFRIFTKKQKTWFKTFILKDCKLPYFILKHMYFQFSDFWRIDFVPLISIDNVIEIDLGCPSIAPSFYYCDNSLFYSGEEYKKDSKEIKIKKCSLKYARDYCARKGYYSLNTREMSREILKIMKRDKINLILNYRQEIIKYKNKTKIRKIKKILNEELSKYPEIKTFEDLRNLKLRTELQIQNLLSLNLNITTDKELSQYLENCEIKDTIEGYLSLFGEQLNVRKFVEIQQRTIPSLDVLYIVP